MKLISEEDREIKDEERTKRRKKSKEEEEVR